MIVYQATGISHSWAPDATKHGVSALGPTPQAACRQAGDVASEAFPDDNNFYILRIKEVVVSEGDYDRGAIA